MQGTAQITMADPKPPSPDDTAQTIASIEAQLDDLLDAIDQHHPAPPAQAHAPAPQAMPPTKAPTELDEIADALEGVEGDSPEPQAMAAAPTPETIDPVDAQEMLAEVNDALAESEQEALSQSEGIVPEPEETPVIDEAPADPSETAAEAAPELSPIASAEAPAEDLDAEIEALLAESSINDEVLAAAEEIAKDDEAKALEDEGALAQRAETAKQKLMSRGDESAEESLGLENELDVGNPAASGSFDQADTADTHEQIAQEIEDLLATEAGESTHDQPAAEEPSIDQIDQMLAEEIDTDDELIGDFQSVEDVAEGIAPSGEGEAIDLSGEPEGASANDVASELDSQPEDLAQTPNADNDEPDDTAERKTPKWKGLLKVAERVALRVCWMLNWPLRQNPVTPQWRSTVGYVALLNLAVGSALFAVGMAKLVF